VWLGEEKSNSDLALDLLAKPVHEAYVKEERRYEAQIGSNCMINYSKFCLSLGAFAQPPPEHICDRRIHLRLPQSLDIHLLHLHDRNSRPLRSLLVLPAEDLLHRFWIHLPANPKLIRQPPTRLLGWIPALSQLVPIIIHFLLICTFNLKAYRFVGFELGPAVECDERGSIEVKLHDHHAAGGVAVSVGPGLGVVSGVRDTTVGEDGGIELGRFFAAVVEPEAGGYLTDGHGGFTSLFGVKMTCSVFLLFLWDRIGEVWAFEWTLRRRGMSL
jgi:hypothetical protein